MRTVREATATQRPRERLTRNGPDVLTDAEVLAIILGTGGTDGVLELAHRVLRESGGPSGLARAQPGQLSGIKGIGPAKAAEIVAALELGRRAARDLGAQRPVIACAEDAAGLLQPRLLHLETETSVALLLDRKHRVLAEQTIGVGGIAHAPLDAREVFAAALRHPGIAAVLVAHNHPSGDPAPSPDDLAVTRRLARAADLLGIELVDHLIIAARGVTSLAELGIL